MTNAPLSITSGAVGRRPQLRADRIRRDALTRLAAALAEDHSNTLQNAIDGLVDAMKQGAPAATLTELVADIEDVADMGRAQIALTDDDLNQLAREAADAVNEQTANLGTVHALPVQQDRRAS